MELVDGFGQDGRERHWVKQERRGGRLAQGRRAQRGILLVQVQEGRQTGVIMYIHMYILGRSARSGAVRGYLLHIKPLIKSGYFGNWSECGGVVTSLCS